MRYVFLGIALIITIKSSAQNWVQRIVNIYKDSIQSYGIVALADNGKIKDTGSIGVSGDKHFITTKNRFCIGSASKMFTATLILKLHEQGRLNIRDSIYQYIPKHNFIDSTITIKQLLNHTSGITDFTKNGFVNTPLLEPYADYSDTYILSRLDTIDFIKGTQYRYSNTNYFILRKIIEIAADKPYEQALQEYIIGPLHMENTFPYYSNQIDQLAHPVINGQDLHQMPKLGTNAISRGAGNIVSDVYDLNKFIRALLIGKTVLKSETLAMMTDFFNYKSEKIGLGLFSESIGNRTVWGHTGRQVSYISYAFIDAESKHSFVVLTNNANDNYAEIILEKLCTAR